MNKGKTFFALWLGVFCCSSIGVEAYVMPPEQLVEYMQDRFGAYKTMVVGQKTVVIDPLEGKESHSSEEKIWVKAPGFFKSQLISGRGRGGAADEPFSHLFRQLLMGNSKEYLLMLLSKFGIGIESSGYTRLNGIVAYYIGYPEPGSSRLLLDKKTFLPILLEYDMRDDSGQKKVSIRFEEYREISGGWYPFKIGYIEGEEIHEQYTVLDLQANMPLSTGMFRQQTVLEKLPEINSKVDDEHLNEAIEALKNKYR